MIDVRFESLTGKKLQLDMLYDPSLGNDHEDDVAEPGGAALLARDTGSPVASAVAGSPAFARTSSTGSGGDLVQTAETSLTGLSGSQSLTVALGFGDTTAAALSAANASLGAGFGGDAHRLRVRLALRTSAGSRARPRAPTRRSTTPR